jgi:hypothetical protein
VFVKYPRLDHLYHCGSDQFWLNAHQASTEVRAARVVTNECKSYHAHMQTEACQMQRSGQRRDCDGRDGGRCHPWSVTRRRDLQRCTRGRADRAGL